MRLFYGIVWNTKLEVAEDVWFDVRYSIERAEPDVGIMQDYIELHGCRPHNRLNDYDIDDVTDEILTQLYREHDL